MGIPPRDFLVLVDSGSADLWVGSENCNRPGSGCGTHNFLGPQSSQTFKDTQQPWKIQSGDKTASGTIVQDNIIIAGLNLTGHTFGTAQKESYGFADKPYDGVMGLGQSTLSAQRTLTPIEALVKNGLVQNAITSYMIGKDGLNGEITFGGLDNTKFNQQSLVTLTQRKLLWAPSP
ncbi:acid protease [Marasmius fiardii PR-910]|nr:acid protease [Marasmius fiardii PR-910]